MHRRKVMSAERQSGVRLLPAILALLFEQVSVSDDSQELSPTRLPSNTSVGRVRVLRGRLWTTLVVFDSSETLINHDLK